MRKILYTCSYGAPSSNTGGPNKIIMELIRNLDPNEFNMSYFSGHFEKFNLGKKDIDGLLNSNAGLRQNSRTFVYNKYKLYRSLVSSKFYLDFSLFKNKIKFQQKIGNISNIEILHSHDALGFYYFKEINSLKILTIHSKGPARLDLQDYVGGRLFPHQVNRINDMELKAFQHSDFVTFPSQYAKELFLRLNKLDDSPKCKIIYNGIDREELDSINTQNSFLNTNKISKDHDMLILNIADHINAKRIDRILLIIKHLVYSKKMNPLFLNVGKGPQTGYLNELVRNYQIQNNVAFMSDLKHSEIINLMKNFDVLLSLSERVIFDMVILEAMACGMVVIASNEGGNKEIIKNGKNGYLVTTQEECIESILNYDSKVSIEAKNTIVEFTREKMIAEYKALYDKII